MGREGQVLHRSPRHLGKWKCAHPVKNRVRKCQPVSSYGAHMNRDTPQFTQIGQSHLPVVTQASGILPCRHAAFLHHTTCGTLSLLTLSCVLAALWGPVPWWAVLESRG